MSGVWARFDRACEYLGTFQGTLGAWLSSNGPTLTQQIEPDRWHVYRWSVRREPDIIEFAVVAADMFHNLRAALDYLVYQLVIANGKVPRPRQNSFPVVRDAAYWASAAGSQVTGVNNDAKEKIKALQPFDSGNPDIQAHYLVQIDDLNNIYKHRLLPMTVCSVTEAEFQFRTAEGSPAS
jgi:hypothetical protein